MVGGASGELKQELLGTSKKKKRRPGGHVGDGKEVTCMNSYEVARVAACDHQ